MQQDAFTVHGLPGAFRDPVLFPDPSKLCRMVNDLLAMINLLSPQAKLYLLSYPNSSSDWTRLNKQELVVFYSFRNMLNRRIQCPATRLQTLCEYRARQIQRFHVLRKHLDRSIRRACRSGLGWRLGAHYWRCLKQRFTMCGPVNLTAKYRAELSICDQICLERLELLFPFHEDCV